MRSIPLLATALFVLVAAPATGQQPNTSTHALYVNGATSTSFPIQVGVPVPSSADFDFVAGGPGPYALLAGRIVQPSTFFGDVGQLDLAPDESLLFILNGFELDTFAYTDIDGLATFPILATFTGLDVGVQALVVDPTVGSGVSFTATTRVVTHDTVSEAIFFEDDDDSVWVDLGPAGVQYAGQSWPGVFVNANGNVTFGAPDSAPSGDAAAMSAGPPRVALAWRDLDPTFYGTVLVRQSVGSVEIDWIDVPVLDPVTGAELPRRLSGRIAFLADGSTTLRLDGAPAGAQLVGFSPGGQPTAATQNLSAVLPLTTPTFAPTFEVFGAGENWDLPAATLSVADDGFGATVVDVDLVPLVIEETLPPVGPSIGYASLLIRGTGFDPGTLVTVGGAVAPVIQVRSREEIHVITPPGAIGPADVVVTHPDGRTDTLNSAYTYETFSAQGFGGPLQPGQSVEYEFDHGFLFPFAGEYRTKLWINANGTVTFDGPNASTFVSDVSFLSGPPRIAALWHDWQWGPGSQAGVYADPYFLNIAFVDLVPAGGGAPASFLLTLSHHGDITFEFDGAPSGFSSSLVGISPGGSVSTAPASDVDQLVGPTADGQAVWQIFSGVAQFDLDGLVWELDAPVDAATSFLSSTYPATP